MPPDRKPSVSFEWRREKEGQLLEKVFHQFSFTGSIEEHIISSVPRFRRPQWLHSQGGTERPVVGEEKQEQIEKMLQADSRRSLRKVKAVVKVHHTIFWQLLRKKLKISLYRVQNGLRILETVKMSGFRSAQLCKQSLEKSPRFFATHHFFRRVLFFVAGCCEQKNCRL